LTPLLPTTYDDYMSSQRRAINKNRCGANALLVMGATLAVSCSDGDIDSLRGSWTGRILCSNSQHDITLRVEVFDNRLSGEGVTRSSGLDKTWSMRGDVAQQDQEQACTNDTCTSNQQCIDKGGTACDELGRCLNCTETIEVSRVSLTLEDDDVQLVNPTLSLTRLGSERMEGAIESFCPDDGQGAPTVQLTKQ
jgi:hypothetical protein